MLINYDDQFWQDIYWMIQALLASKLWYKVLRRSGFAKTDVISACKYNQLQTAIKDIHLTIDIPDYFVLISLWCSWLYLDGSCVQLGSSQYIFMIILCGIPYTPIH